jgi:hypothetical protein
VDGRFDASKKDYRLKFKGSSNQRVIDVGRSIVAGKAVEAAFTDYAPCLTANGYNVAEIRFSGIAGKAARHTAG